MGDEKMQAASVDIDGILLSIGVFGKYQVKTFLVLIFAIMMTSLHANNYIFSAMKVDYRCRVPICDVDSEYDQPWLDNAIPKNDKCNMYAMINSTRADDHCPAELFDHTNIIPCDEHIFKNERTFVEEFGIVCEEWKRTLVGTLHSVGTLLTLPIIGFISDKYGRRFAMILALLLEGSLGVVKGLSVNYAMFLTFELLEPTFGSGGYSSAYILGLETLTPKTRVLGGVLINLMFGSSQILEGLIAWAIPYWRTFLIVIYAPTLISFGYRWLLLESTRWLLQKKRYPEVIDNIKYIAKTNGKPLPVDLMKNLYYNSDNAAKIELIEAKTDNKNDSEFKQFLRSKIMILRVLKCSFWWITCTFSFYGLSINSVFLKGNVYQNFIYSACMEVPAHILGYFGLTYLGRKKVLFIAFLIAGLSCLSFAFIPEGYDELGLMSYLIGKLFATMSFASIYLYTSEIFPTSMRHMLLATCSMVGRIGSIAAPQTPLLTVYLEELPSILFGSTCLISALLMLTSPETLKLRLPETIEEAERITELKIKE